MELRSIGCTGNAPIWAWHSCQNYEHAPRLTDARCLLSDLEIRGGIRTIVFESPVGLALLSSYGLWNVMLHEKFTPCRGAVVPTPEIEARLFDRISKRKFRKHDSIQATVPYLKLEWVKEIRDLNLKPDDWLYHQEEGV